MAVTDTALAAEDTALARAERGLDWVWRSSSLRAMALLVIGYALTAWFTAPDAFASLLGHYTKTLKFFILILIAPICAIGVIDWLRGSPGEAIVSHLISRLPAVTLLAALLLVVFTSYTTLKFMIPNIVPFYADSWAADLDAWLHLGDAWHIAHAIWPDSWSGFIFLCYNYTWFFYWFGTPMFTVLWLSPEKVRRYLWSMILTFLVCGTLLAYAFSSVGPVFYADVLGDGRYDALTARLGQLDGMDKVLGYAAYLYASYEGQQAVFGTGISAIPSMHVAVVTLNGWLFTSLNRWAGLVAWLFAAIILLGSVYTGWHYAIDGYLSFLAVTAIWFAVKRAHAGKGEGRRWRIAQGRAVSELRG